MKPDTKFYHRLRIRFAEVDQHGHVFNAHYLTYFDTSITEYLRYLDFPAFNSAYNIAFFVKKNLVEYYAPIYFDQEIAVAVEFGHIGNSSLTFKLTIFLANENHPLASGEVVWVCVDATTRQKTSLPAELKQKLIDLSVT